MAYSLPGVISSGFSDLTGLQVRPYIPGSVPQPGTSTSFWGRLFQQGLLARVLGTAQPAVTAPRSQSVVKLGIGDLFGISYVRLEDHDDDDDDLVHVHVYIFKYNKYVHLEVNESSTVSDLKGKVATNLGLSQHQTLLLFLNGKKLGDRERIKKLKISAESLILGTECPSGQVTVDFELDALLDDRYDYDFTSQADDGKTYWRGGHVYQRPYGWKRYAVKVRGEYADDIWLGEDGIRTASTPGEWVVSYHGTGKRFIESILEKGYKSGPRQRFGPGVYSSPSLAKIEEYGYAKTFTYDGKTYKLALQNRVDPKYMKVIPPEKTGLPGFPYWLCPFQDPESGIHHIRPYGILIREVPSSK